jgi:MoxR-like ATPase
MAMLPDLNAERERLKKQSEVIRALAIAPPAKLRTRLAEVFPECNFKALSVEERTKEGRCVVFPYEYFYLAAAAVPFLVALRAYKELVDKAAAQLGLNHDQFAVAIEDARSGRGISGALSAEFSSLLGNDAQDLQRLERFLTDYTSWGGGKSVARGQNDFHVSAILDATGLLAASSGHVVTLCERLVGDPELVEAVNEFNKPRPAAKVSKPSPAVAGMLSKPFLILTGNSGTGKTKLAERLAETYRDKDDLKQAGNYAVVAVGADWTDNRSVVGFVNHLREASFASPPDTRAVYQSTPVLDLLLHADGHKDWPHFLILDEMNLSHVERYFADFLSAMEARDGVLRLHAEGPADHPDYRLPRSGDDKVGVPRQLAYPENLFVIGTVNVDETTYMFSPKVLDRAHVIEFEVDPDAIKAFLEKPEPLLPATRAPDTEAFDFLKLSKDARGIDGGSVELLPDVVADGINGHLMDVLRILQRGRFEFAFRTANEVNTYLRVCRQLARDKNDWDAGAVLSKEERKEGRVSWMSDLDDEILQKILPRLHGSRSRAGNLVGALVSYFATGEEAEALQFFPAERKEEATRTLTDAVTWPSEGAKFPRCFKKMQTMARVLVEEQFVSFIC